MTTTAIAPLKRQREVPFYPSQEVVERVKLFAEDEGRITTDAEYDWFTSAVRRNFWLHVNAVHAARGFHKRAPLSDIERDMCQWAAYGATTPGDPLAVARMLLAFRLSGKTDLIVCNLPTWQLNRDPERKTLIVSQSKGFAQGCCDLIRKMIDSLFWLRHLKPPPKSPSVRTRDNLTEFDVANIPPHKQPSVRNVGIDGQTEGNHAHTILGDDLETKANSKTFDARASLARMVSEFRHIMYDDTGWEAGETVDPSMILIVGTVKHDESLYFKLGRDGYSCRTYPLRFPRPTHKVYRLAPLVSQKLEQSPGLEDSPLCPLRMSEEQIAKKYSGIANPGATSREYLEELMCCEDVGRLKRYPLKLSDLIVMPVPRTKAPLTVAWGKERNGQSLAYTDGEIGCMGLEGDALYRPVFHDEDPKNWHAYTGTIAYLDPASGKAKDESGFTIASWLGGNIWIHEATGIRIPSIEAQQRQIAAMCRDYRVMRLYVEDNADIFGSFIPTLEAILNEYFIKPAGEEPGWSCSVERVHETQTKELRIIEALEPVMSHHQLIIDPKCLIPTQGLDIDYELQHQISRVRAEKGSLNPNDRVDALASAVRRANDHAILRQSPKEQADRITHDTLEQEELDKLLKSGAITFEDFYGSIR